VTREDWLVKALDLLAAGEVQGRRRLQPSGHHPFLLRWQAGEAPQEPSRCELSFPASEAVTYQFVLPAHQLVRWLMDLLEDRGRALDGEPGGDLPQAFWRWLILGEPPPAETHGEGSPAA
jgi:hypothetical protein